MIVWQKSFEGHNVGLDGSTAYMIYKIWGSRYTVTYGKSDGSGGALNVVPVGVALPMSVTEAKKIAAAHAKSLKPVTV